MKKVKKKFKVGLMKINGALKWIKNELGSRGKNFSWSRFAINSIIYFVAFYTFVIITIGGVNKFTKAEPNIVYAYNFFVGGRQYTSEPPPEKWLFIYDYTTHLGTSHELIIINDGNKIAKNILIEIKTDEPIASLSFTAPYSKKSYFYNDYEIKKGFDPKLFLDQTVIEVEDLNNLDKSEQEKFRKGEFKYLYERNKYLNINIPELFPFSGKEDPCAINIRFRVLYERIVFRQPKIKISMLHKNKEIIAKESEKYRRKFFSSEEIIISDNDISTSYLIQNESDFEYKTWKESNMKKFQNYFKYPEDNPYHIHLIPTNYKWPPPDISKATLSFASREWIINPETMEETFFMEYEKYDLNNIKSIIQYEVDLSRLVVENNELFVTNKYNKIIGYSFENDGIFPHEYSIIDTDGDGLFDIRYPKYFLEFPDWCFDIKGPKYNVNINKSSELELEAYLDIDTSLVKKIIKNRPYKKVEDLFEKKILTKEQFKKIKEKALLKIID